MPPTIDSGDTAWILMSTALVMLMTPGLAFFYGGLVRGKNVLSTVMHSFIVIGLVSILWVVVGYSLAFGGDVGNGFIGNMDYFGLKNVGMEPSEIYGTHDLIDQQTGDVALAFEFNEAEGRYLPIEEIDPDTGAQMIDPETGQPVYVAAKTGIPHILWMVFQMTFAIITPALITGAFAERAKFGPFLAFMGIWSLAVYAPIAHWVWSPNGWLLELGALDFAGGTVVHINAGAAALVAAMLYGRRAGFGKEPMEPHNIPFVVLGASLLWFGWFGFNAGSALGATGLAAMAFTVTFVAAAAAMLTWTLLSWTFSGKPSIVGAAAGAVAGLVAITPAAGFVDTMPAIAIGVGAGALCYGAVQLRIRMRLDDSLDVVGVHGVGGAWGAFATGIFAVAAVGGVEGLIEGNGEQLLFQLAGIGAVFGYSFVMTYVILKVLDMLFGLRVTDEEEQIGVDASQHGERGYVFEELGGPAYVGIPQPTTSSEADAAASASGGGAG